MNAFLDRRVCQERKIADDQRTKVRAPLDDQLSAFAWHTAA